MRVDVVFTRPGWVGWLAGSTQHLRLWVTAPRAHVQERWLRVKPGAPVEVSFDRPVSQFVVTGAGRPALREQVPRSRTVSLGRLAAAGSIRVSAVTRPWERFPRATPITWFPQGGATKVLASPRPGSQLSLHTPLVLRFSEPVRGLFRGRMPSIPEVSGSWRVKDAHTLEFTPRGFGFGLDTRVRMRLPAAVEPIGGASGTTNEITWTTPTASDLRLQQLLAQLGYLPLQWKAATWDADRTLESQMRAAVDPPPGRFTWRYANTPASLVGLWQTGHDNTIIRGAVMAFQYDHGLDRDGDAGRHVWQALITAAIAGDRARTAYSYVIVHREQRPQSLVVWHEGQTVISTPANTGIPVAPTVFGTFPVYARYTVTTMRGTNPDGTRYSDPGIPWVSYFNGGDAIHGFTRASYGSPQSLGCVELPASEAARVWPYTPIGTLVTVTA
jgi:peptidoglycan hydrolase-like protein with peptidoglycan-binding domain